MKLNPYLIFNGNAEEVLNFYKTALGGEIVMLSRYGDSPMPTDEDYKNKIMHSRLVFDGNLVMISDGMKGQPMPIGGNVQLSVEVESIERINEVFEKMSEGGTVSMELQDTFWGARFGMLIDKFGVSWMFNHELKPATSQA
ncbi:VOC family protein [Foetidibacter luteolus]|uniref:VOC family protein n=1 Tax=Foetidibacter luteolus TaxID=2608880 RepID=UPI00129A63A3|nr:VOC family protein [Foetidibacter luteolus]